MQLRDMWKHPFVEIDHWSQLNKDTDVLYTSENPELRTCHVEHFLEWMKLPVSQWLYRFELTDAVRQAVESVDVTSNCIGIHLRHDLKPPQTVGIEWFENRVLHLRKAFPAATFFLATDAKEPSDRIRAILPSHCLIEQPKDYSFDKLDVQKAVADLYILAKLPWFIASNASTYSEIVCFMRGGIPRHSKRGGVGQHSTRRTVSGGNYEDAWNTAEDKQIPLC